MSATSDVRDSISWRTPSSPMPAEIRPRAVFERLFGAADDGPRTRRYEKSILDLVSSDAQRLNARVGAADKRKLDEYLFSIRDLEKRIASAGAGTMPGTRSLPWPFRAPVFQPNLRNTRASCAICSRWHFRPIRRGSTPDGEGTLLDHSR